MARRGLVFEMRAAAIVGVALFTACCRGAGVEVRNLSAARVENVVITASGSSARIDSVEPKSYRRTAVCPKGEAGNVGIAFTANSRSYNSEYGLYFECDWQYLVKITIAPDFAVEATATLRP
jgi:hypothetical protein